MTDILYYLTLALDFIILVFAAVYLWINIYGKFTSMYDRKSNVIKITKISMIISLVFAFLTSLLSDSSDISAAILKTAGLYSIIAITLLVVIFACVVTMLVIVISKKLYRPEIADATKDLFKITLPGAAVALVLTWLFS